MISTTQFGAISVAVSFCFAAMAFGREFYVAPGGSDLNDGSKERPFASLERARDAGRAAGSAEGSTIWLKGGLYTRRQPLDLAAADSGLTIRGMAGEEVRISGGCVVTTNDLQPVTDQATLARIAVPLRGKIVAADLAALGITHRRRYPEVFTDTGNVADLFFNGARMPLSRYPNKGYMTIRRVLCNAGGLTNRDWNASLWTDQPLPGHGGVFEYREEVYAKFALWKEQLDRGVWFKGYWRIPWQNEAIRVAAIDTDQHTVRLAEPVPGGIGNKYTRPEGNGKEPYWLLNLLEEIDRPGEWCVDFKDQKLYFYPPAPLASAVVTLADSTEPVIRLAGASRVTLRGLTIEENLGDGIDVTGGEGNLIAGCTVRNVDQYAVVIREGRQHTVLSCDLYNLGAGGVSLSGGDDQATPRVPAGHRVVNNHIHHFSQITRIYAPAVKTGFVGGSGAGHQPAVGMLVAHNLIHDTPHAGVLSASFDSVFEYNEIFRFALISNDIGALYCYDNQKLDGNRTFRYNLIHHSDEGDALYFDMDHAAMKIYGNIVYLNGTGKRGAGLIFKDGSQRTSPPQTSEVHDNVFMRCAMGGLVFAATNAHNLVERNVVAQCRETWDWRELGADGKFRKRVGFTPAGNGVYDKDPGFVDAARLDFRLKPDSPILKDMPDFKLPPLEKIGLFLDEYRTTLPDASAIRRYELREGDAALDSEIMDRL